MITYEADSNKYTTVSILGHCCNKLAIVYLAKHVRSEKLIAIKKFNMDKAKEEANLIQQEIIVTKQLQHPNIIQYYTAFVTGSEVCVLSPLMAYGSCKDLLINHFNEGLPEGAIVLILRSLLEGLEYLHKKGLIHRAIRASHILIAANGQVCLSGLKYSCPIVERGRWQRQIHSFPSSTANNLNWLSPELLEQNLQGYNEKSDMYSVGITICELANGSEPFAGMPTTLMLTEKVRGSAPQLLDCTTAIQDPDGERGDGLAGFSGNQCTRRFSEGLHQVAALCLQKEARLRPSPTQLLTHSYFKHVRRNNATLPEYLKPVLPISERIAQNIDEVADFEVCKQLSELEVSTCEWDF